MTTNWILLALLFLPAGLMADIADDYHNYLDGSTTCGRALLNRRTIQIAPYSKSAAPYVFNGNDSYYGEWPFTAWVRLNKSRCSGVIYSSRVVFTSGHCIRTLFKDWDIGVKTEITDRKTPAYVVVGKISPKTTDKFEARYEVEAVQAGAYFAQRKVPIGGPNFARVWLREPIKFSHFVEPVCILKDVGEIDKVAQGQVFFIGNGHNNTPPDTKLLTYPDKSQWLEMKTCDPDYWNPNLNVSRTHAAASYCPKGNHYRALCRGDTGGPLVGLDKNRRWSLVGIANFYFGDCHSGGGDPGTSDGFFAMMDKIVGMFDKNFKPDPKLSAIRAGRTILREFDDDDE